MSCDRMRELMMGAIDGELTPDEDEQLRRHLATCASCRVELESFQRLQEVTEAMRIVLPEDRFWDGYWEDVYRRLERRLGWVLFSLGALVLLLFGGFHLAKEFLFNPDVPYLLRGGAGLLGTGGLILLVSAARERLYAYRSERYKDVRR